MGTLCKIGRREHIVALQESGVVYMNTLDVFWDIEDGGLRGDNLDGIDYMANGIHAKLRTPSGEIIPANVTSWTLQTKTAEPKQINLFCMYAIRRDPSTNPIDPRVIEFGDAALIMTNPDEFMRRLASAAGETSRSFKQDLVNYVPTKYVGDIGLFTKTELYRFQSDWRFAMYDGPENPVALNIGNISDISLLIDSCDLFALAAEYRSGALDIDAGPIAG